ncbi:transporter substrate-binding domain-containing protein [Celerinatantimonas sp. MCCC 1A17872]|uniref:transporter substrate-binding domain-containing protein n=1 Tax=Celerinatantimonas sp. MCCC 1A17872 TaxID=3177514 RepID=UPI0038C366CF
MSFYRNLALSVGALLAFNAFAQSPVRVAIDPTYPPMEFMQDGHRVGFDIDLAKALEAKMQRKFEYTDMDFKALVPSILANRQDIVLSAIYITPARKKVVDFTTPYFSAGLVALVNNDGNVHSLSDLDGKTVAVQVGTKSVVYMKTHFPKVKLMEVETNESMFNALQSKRAQAVVTGRPAALTYARKTGKSHVLNEMITHENYGIAVSKNKPELKAALDKAIKEVKADGTYNKLMKKWFASK